MVGQIQLASAILCANLVIMFVKLLFWRVEIKSFLGLALILACITLIFLSVTLLMSVPLVYIV